MRLDVVTRSLALAIFGASLTVPAQAEIVIGAVNSLTGPIAAIGTNNERGIRAGVAFTGTIAGETVRVIYFDDASDAANASKLARKLIEEDHVDVLIGTAGAPSTSALVSVATELKVPMVAISPILSVPKNDGLPWAVTMIQTPSDMVGAVVDHIAKTGAKTVGYIGFNDGYGDLVYNSAIAAAARDGLTFTSNERYARADTSVTGQVLKVLSTKPDAILTGGSGSGGALPYVALAERGYKGAIYGNAGTISPDLLRIAGKSAEGTVACTGPITVVAQLPDGHPNKKIGLDFKDIYLKTNGIPVADGFSAYGFDGWLVLADSAKRALATGAKPGTPEFRAAIRAAMYTTKDLVGTQGTYTWTPASHFGTDLRSVVLVKLENGEWKLVN